MTGEFDLIARHLAPLAGPGAFGLTDDAALAPGGRDLVITKDLLNEGVHFRASDPIGLVARKALRANLSDLAAMGATPVGYLLGLAAARSRLTDAAFAEIAAGLAEDQAAFGISLLGGDTTRAEAGLTVSVTAVGAAPETGVLRRSAAHPGDAVFVTGSIGDAGLGLRKADAPAALAPADRAYLERRHLLPEPRIAFAAAAAPLIRACADVSDGLVADAGHVADASGLRIEIEEARTPLSEAFRRWRALGGPGAADACVSGDDYELVFTAPPDREEALAAAAARAGTRVTRIGRCLEGEGVALLDASGAERALARRGWDHAG